MAKRRLSNREMRDIAASRMSILLTMAREEGLAGNMARSKRYFRLARSVSMRTNVPLPPGTLFCKKCQALLLPGRNCRVRLRSGKIIVHCLDCDGVRRRPFGEREGERHGEETD